MEITCVNDSWTGATEGDCLWERRVGWVEVDKKGKHWDNCNRINKKIK